MEEELVSEIGKEFQIVGLNKGYWTAIFVLQK